MAIVYFDTLTRKHPRIVDFVMAIVIAVGITGLFIFDMSAPRGEVDGVGYAAMVALCVHFGDRALIASAVLTTVLTLIASFIVPDAGISVAGMWANRSFAVIGIWIVAIILFHRIRLETYVANRESSLRTHQRVLGRIVREALLSEQSSEERVRFITEQGAEALKADFCAIQQQPEPDGPIYTLNVWDRRRARHFVVPDIPANDAPGFRETMLREFMVHADDVLTSELHRSRRELLGKLGIRAILTADTLNDIDPSAIVFAFKEPHHWTEEEFAFARALANLVALFFAAGRNSRTLAALEQVSEGICLEDKNGILRYANRAATELSRSTTAEPNAHLFRFDTPLTGRSDMSEISFRGRDLEIQRLRLPDEDVLMRINDVTERNAVLTERRALDERLQRSAKMEAIGQLAGGVAHDFNNILGAILGFAGFLKQDLPKHSPEHGFAERILNACERGKALVEQIMAFARVRAVDHGVVDLGQTVRRNHDYLAGLLPNQILIHMHLPDGALPISGSAVQIGQLITNLFLNARESFVDNGGAIEIRVRLARSEEIEQLRRGTKEFNERSWGEVQSGRSYALLQVEDEGSGISPNILDRIFEPFFTTKGRQHGTGLGLAVVHGAVELLGGACHVRSVLGEGTVFSIYFPLVSRLANNADIASKEPANLGGAERILIVDDERDIADMLCIGLERLGYETVGVNDPRQALAAFMEDPEAFDVVVTDQVMPALRGLELIRRLKEIKPDIKTVLCTGYSDGANEEIARQAGADAFFQKPVDSRQVAIGIRLLLDRCG